MAGRVWTIALVTHQPFGINTGQWLILRFPSGHCGNKGKQKDWATWQPRLAQVVFERLFPGASAAASLSKLAAARRH